MVWLLPDHIVIVANTVSHKRSVEDFLWPPCVSILSFPVGVLEPHLGFSCMGELLKMGSAGWAGPKWFSLGGKGVFNVQLNTHLLVVLSETLRG
jgi:hypothetical protein